MAVAEAARWPSSSEGAAVGEAPAAAGASTGVARHAAVAAETRSGAPATRGRGLRDVAALSGREWDACLAVRGVSACGSVGHDRTKQVASVGRSGPIRSQPRSEKIAKVTAKQMDDVKMPAWKRCHNYRLELDVSSETWLTWQIILFICTIMAHVMNRYTCSKNL